MAMVKHLSPSSVHPPRGYSHIVSVEGPHKTIEIAGQLGLTPDGALPDNYEEQVKQSFRNLKACLDAAGSPTILKLRYYVKDYVYPTSLTPITDAKNIILNEKDPLPASVLVSVPQLGHPGFLFEVEATAVIQG